VTQFQCKSYLSHMHLEKIQELLIFAPCYSKKEMVVVVADLVFVNEYKLMY